MNKNNLIIKALNLVDDLVKINYTTNDNLDSNNYVEINVNEFHKIVSYSDSLSREDWIEYAYENYSDQLEDNEAFILWCESVKDGLFRANQVDEKNQYEYYGLSLYYKEELRILSRKINDHLKELA